MYRVLFLSICILKHALALGTLNATSYPLPKLNIVGNYDAFYEGQTINFDARSSYLPSTSLVYYYKFEIGADVTHTTSPRVTKILSAGTYDVSLSINDQPFINSSSYSYGVTRGGYPAPTTSIKLQILPRKHCYHYNVTVDWNPYITASPMHLKPYGGGDVRLWVSVVDYNDALPVSQNTLTNAFASIGIAPSLQLSNGTHQFNFPSSDFTYAIDRWRIDLPFEHFNSSWPVIGVFEGNLASLQSCTIAPETVDLTFPWIQSSTIGYDMDSYEALNGHQSGMLMNSSQYIPQKLKISFDHCNRKQGIATLGVSSQSLSARYLGALSILSSNSFENFTLNDLSRSSNNIRISNSSLCANLNMIDCSNIQIMDTISVSSHLFTLTTLGLFSSSSLFVETNQTSPISFRKIYPLSDDVSFMNSTRIFGKSDCFNSLQNYIFVLRLSVTSTLLYGTVGDLTRYGGPVWSSVYIGAVNGISKSSVFFGAARDVINHRNIYLAGTLIYGSDQIACSGNSSCLINQGAIIVDLGDQSPNVTFSFPSNLKISGMEFQSKTNNLYVFGSEVWTSSDGGYTFSQIHAGLFSDDEYFVEFDSGIYSDAYIMRTNLNRIFYGSILSANILEIRSIGSHQEEHMVISADNTGSFWTFSVPSNYTGYITSSGSIRTALTESPLIIRRRIPIKFEKANLDESAGLTLIPIWNGPNSLQFYVNGSGSISKDLSGYKINHENGGEFAISHISSDGKMLYGNLKSPLIPESEAQSPATFGLLSVLGITTRRDAIQQNYPSQPLNYVNLVVSNILSNGWIFSDVGKTIVFNMGSILITSITNNTYARGIVISPPKDTADAISGSWKIYDFRSFYEYPIDPTQSLTIIYNSTGSYGYPVPSLMSLNDLSKSYLLTDSGWGVVGLIENSSMRITAFHPFKNGSYSPGSWRLVRAEPSHLSGRYPLEGNLMRNWSITVDECPVLYSSSNFQNPIQYIGYDFTEWYRSSFTFVLRKNFSIIPEVNLKFVNSEYFNKSISKFWDPYLMKSEGLLGLFS